MKVTMQRVIHTFLWRQIQNDLTPKWTCTSQHIQILGQYLLIIKREAHITHFVCSQATQDIEISRSIEELACC